MGEGSAGKVSLTIRGRDPNFVAAYTAAVESLMPAANHIMSFWPVPRPKYPTIYTGSLLYALYDGWKIDPVRMPRRAFPQQVNLGMIHNALLGLLDGGTVQSVETFVRTFASTIDADMRSVRPGGARQRSTSLVLPATFSYERRYVNRLEQLTRILDRALTGEASAYCLAAVELTNRVFEPWSLEMDVDIEDLHRTTSIVRDYLDGVPAPIFAPKIEYDFSDKNYGKQTDLIAWTYTQLYGLPLPDLFRGAHQYLIRSRGEIVGEWMHVFEKPRRVEIDYETKVGSYVEQSHRVAYGLSLADSKSLGQQIWTEILERRGLPLVIDLV